MREAHGEQRIQQVHAAATEFIIQNYLNQLSPLLAAT
jgi:hypothetical protein